MLARIIIALIMTVALLFIDVTGWLQLSLYLIVYLIIGGDILKKAWAGIINGRVFDGGSYHRCFCIGNIRKER